MSLRLAWVIIRNLPDSSAFKRAIDPDGTRWTESEHLLAGVIDAVHRLAGIDHTVPRPGSPEEKAAIASAQRRTSIRERGIARRLARRELEAKAKEADQ